MMFRVPTLAFNFERMADEVVFSWTTVFTILMSADSKKIPVHTFVIKIKK
jgi:hypothetical protein